MQLLHCCLPNSVINRGIYSPSVLVTGTFAPNAITIGTMLHQSEPTILNGSEVSMGTFQFYSEKAEMSYRAWPNGTWMTFVISRERLLSFCAEHLDGIPNLPNSGIVTIEPGSGEMGYRFLARLRDLTRSLQAYGSLPHTTRLGASVENDLLGRIATLMSAKPLLQRANDRSRLRLCSEVLRDAIKLVERDPAEILDLESMSKATGLSPRTLQRTFQAEYGLCPQEWLRVERLNEVREDLLQNGNSVTHTATRWGFFHLSRFSQYYRELFGERPSETLARRNAVRRSSRAETTEAQFEHLAS
jgi:AraC-like DNA-binding protein